MLSQKEIEKIKDTEFPIPEGGRPYEMSIACCGFDVGIVNGFEIAEKKAQDAFCAVCVDMKKGASVDYCRLSCRKYGKFSEMMDKPSEDAATVAVPGNLYKLDSSKSYFSVQLQRNVTFEGGLVIKCTNDFGKSGHIGLLVDTSTVNWIATSNEITFSDQNVICQVEMKNELIYQDFPKIDQKKDGEEK